MDQPASRQLLERPRGRRGCRVCLQSARGQEPRPEEDADQLDWLPERQERAAVHGRAVEYVGRRTDQPSRNSPRAYR